MIKDEVLKITSEQLRDSEIYPVTYNVADLVIPIPNFVPNNRMGLQGLAGRRACQSWPGAACRASARREPCRLASQDGRSGSGMVNPAVLAQMKEATGGMGGRGAEVQATASAGPGGIGGGQQADFDSLIDLITSTIHPRPGTKWAGRVRSPNSART